MKRNIEYKHLDEEMKKSLDEEIKRVGRDKLYEIVRKNIVVEKIAELTSAPGAFDIVRRGIWETESWKKKYFSTPEVIDFDNLTLGQEMLCYIDKRRFCDPIVDFEKSKDWI